jgi:hypothetical protein
MLAVPQFQTEHLSQGPVPMWNGSYATPYSAAPIHNRLRFARIATGFSLYAGMFPVCRHVPCLQACVIAPVIGGAGFAGGFLSSPPMIEGRRSTARRNVLVCPRW